jgi:hypothetical protein
MAAFNIVRFRVRPGMEQAFLDAHRDGKAAWPGLIRGTMIATGERRYALIGEWPDMATLARARPQMIATLDTFRHALEELEPGLGVTDAISGEAALSLT